MEKIRIRPGSAYPLGLFKTDNTIMYSAAYNGTESCGLCLFAQGGFLLILFDDTFRKGRIVSAEIENIPPVFDSYLIFENGKLYPDPYARRLLFSEKEDRSDTADSNGDVLFAYDYKEIKSAPRGSASDYTRLIRQTAADELTLCKITDGSDACHSARPFIPYASSFFYCLNVRGYTMQDKSVSKRSERGTFKGLTQKIPYLKELGVTAVELMPIFEINSRVTGAEGVSGALLMSDGTPAQVLPVSERPNLWGYQDGFYFAVRSLLSSDQDNPGKEFSQMVEAFHASNMEVILQFWFAPQCPGNLMVECIRYYVLTYCIDGIHLKSDNIPEDLILSDPLLADIKILIGNRMLLHGKNEYSQSCLAHYGEDFMWRARHFLKGDDLSLLPFVESAFSNATAVPEIHYICNYDGFTLRDLVTYEHKRNEANGEHSEDGRYDNVSWNCGVEGETRKKQILTLRKKQMLNALSFVFLSFGVPLIYAGDESGNTQSGNNNPYCQDNSVGWTDCDVKGKYSYLSEYVRFLAGLRKLFTERSLQNKLSGGKSSKTVPDLSFHGVEAWKPDYGNNSHSIGVMFAAQDGTSLFIAFNMYWKDITFSLPCSCSNGQWYILSDTAKEQPVFEVPEVVGQNCINAEARSVVICKCVRNRKG